MISKYFTELPFSHYKILNWPLDLILKVNIIYLFW